MLRIDQYTTKPELIEAVQVSRNNAEEVAKWVGGKVDIEAKPSDPTDISMHVLVPTLRGALRVSVGQYIVRDKTFGSFFAMEDLDFTNKYSRVGLRQDGPGFKNASRVTFRD